MRAAIEEPLKRDEPADAANRRVYTDAGQDYASEDFLGYWESCGVADVALEAARLAWSKVPNMIRDELVEIVHRGNGTES
ncbi:hypothetical protein [Allorhizocola rhizosphaerae]|uniref:hypothetical protein n=1 Tax=Allorhizocola rhizosphaerae TaxID=1872709 RepID=UPI000E3E1E01|nr:hypothetical protein [Allorhizocola rhizosphaerae]